MKPFDGKKLISCSEKLEEGQSVQWTKEHAIWHPVDLVGTVSDTQWLCDFRQNPSQPHIVVFFSE